MKKNVFSPFIELIWEIVSDPVTNHIITWSPNGTSFYIINPVAFAEEILTNNFKHQNVSSFVRQLNMYNFHKNKSNLKEQEFFHKLFRRDARKLLMGIKRKPSEFDQRQGDEMLRQFLLEKYEHNSSATGDKSQCYHENTKEDPHSFQLNFPDQFSQNLFSFNKRKISAICTETSEKHANETKEPILEIVVPKKLLNIIIVEPEYL